MTTTFEYAVRDRTGKLVKGVLDGDSTELVATRLVSMGYSPVEIKEANAGLKKEIKIPGFSDRVKLKDLAVFCRQFATMISSGLSLIRSLNISCEQTENKELARVLAEVRDEVEAGGALSDSLGKYPLIFPSLMVNMIRAGEVGGFLDDVMTQVADNFESEVKLRGKVKSAMTYPTVVFVIAILSVIGMLLFIVPTFTSLFISLGGKLPLPTQILVDLSHAMKIIAPIAVVFIIAFVIVWPKVKNSLQVRNVLDPLKLRMPVFGQLFQKIALSRFARNLSTMMSSGVPILQSLDIVADTTGNVVVARAIRDVQDSVRRGESLAGPLTQHSVFPSMVVQMMSVGEDTGALDTMLAKIGDFYDAEVEATTEALTSLIEPLMIVVLGGIIGSMIIALYLPIFKVFDLIK